MLRMIASLSAICAWRGSSSQICMPGVFVAIGLNSPRISAGASGFMSYMSMWLGPPLRRTMMTDLARGAFSSARSRSRSASIIPPRPRLPKRRNLLRERPGQDDLGRGSIKEQALLVHAALRKAVQVLGVDLRDALLGDFQLVARDAAGGDSRHDQSRSTQCHRCPSLPA